MGAETATAASEPNAEPTWCRYPNLYEINTWVWLSDLARKYGSAVDLSSVPAAEWDGIAEYGFDAVWLMGVWERSPAAVDIARHNDALLDAFRRALPDFHPDDIVGSPYCVRNYVVDLHLGGPEGLAIARHELAKRGMKLILDFVPNHVAPDHPWLIAHPEYFIHGTAGEVESDPLSYIKTCGLVFACGRDPYFPPWPDVVQLNAFNPGLRDAIADTVLAIAEQCDGVRCDMAMLVMNTVFERTWSARAGSRPPTEYWVELISAVKKSHPRFLFIAEAYWDLEWELQQQGFDFCYDKKLYDAVEHGNADNIREHLCAAPAYQDKLLRFIENHDEPRAAATFSNAKQRAFALSVATLPGTKLFYEGQFEGRTVRLPVFLGRRPDELDNGELQKFYRKLLVHTPAFRDGQWSLCELSGWPDNPTFRNVVAWNWVNREERYLIIINFSHSQAQARVRIQWNAVSGNEWRLTEAFSGTIYERDGNEMLSPGLYVDLGPWNFHFFQCAIRDTKERRTQGGAGIVPSDL